MSLKILSCFILILVSQQALAQDAPAVVSPQLDSVQIGNNSLSVYTLQDPDARNASFNEGAETISIAGEIGECEMLIDIPAGTAHGDHSYGGYCKITLADAEKKVMVCNDDLVGYFAVKYAPVITTDKKSLIEFVVNNCTGG